MSAPGLLLYLALLMGCVLTSPRCSPRWRRRGWAVLANGSALALGAAAWFVSRQVLDHQYCPICLSIHALGVMIAGVVWIHLLSGRAGPRRASDGSPITTSIATAMIGVGLLIGGQTSWLSSLFGRFLMPTDQAGRQLADPLSGIPVDDLPTLGSRHAAHRIVVLADYTCVHCRQAHFVLQQLRERLSNDVAIVIVPMPLDSRCNPFLRQTDRGHEHACELARLALQVWRIDPERFADMDSWLFGADAPSSVAEARGYAAILVGEDQMRREEADPWVAGAITRATQLYARCGGGVVPKILIDSTLLDGAPEGPRPLIVAARQAWGPAIMRDSQGN